MTNDPPAAASDRFAWRPGSATCQSNLIRKLDPATKRLLMSNFRRFLLWSLLAGFLSIIIPAIRAASGDDTPAQETELHLQGIAHRKPDGVIAITLTNKSPDGCDYLIEYTDPSIDDLDEDAPNHLLKVSLPHTFGGGLLARVAVSEANQDLITADQMLRFKIQLPDEQKDAKIDRIKLSVSACKTPITGKKIILSHAVVDMPLRPVAKEPDAGD